MSDARTRLVSAAAGIAVLATGVVLGSGPLRAALLGETGDRLDALEADVAAQEERADDAEARADTAAAYVDATAPTLLIDLLPGTAVVVVAAPGAPDAVIEAVEARLPLAGAEETGAVALGDAWNDDATSQFRTALAEQVAPSLVGVDAVEPSAVLAHAFVQGATGAAPTGADRADVGDAGTDRGAVLWDLLAQADLAEGEAATRADAILLIAGGKDATAALADAFAAYDAPVTVVGAPAAISAQSRRDDVATVASSDWTMGSVTAVAAVSETLAGDRPHYRDGEVPAVLGVS
ncbi:copper transporter [Demequina rhizosphaerae]|uniref:copper transporter n=1 Tax=Demequina rhizosphaerae TaxID=1638985 RepID=UPI000784EB00|nr:copper transporter [Demequina rhizosphaerae]